jgi:hypothetical protein
MYDATDDPYTYENSTVLVNKLDLRDQSELDDFEAEITNARAGKLFLKATWTLRISARSIIIYSRMCSIGRAIREQCVFRSRGAHSVFLSISTPKQPSCSLT